MDQRVEPRRNQGPKLKASDRLDKWRRIGYRLFLYGMTPEHFMETSSAEVLAYLTTFMTLGIYVLHEIIAALFFSRSLLEGITHAYIMTYLLIFLIQWYYILSHIRNFHENEVCLEQFESTQAHFTFAEYVLDRNLNDFFKYLLFAFFWWFTNSFSHLCGPLIEFAITFIWSGEVIQISILPQVFILPKWGQVLMYIHNAVTTFSLLLYCVANFLVMGLRAVKVKTQCDILNEALRNDTGKKSDVRAYIRDHIEVLRAAKVLNGQLSTVNSVIFTGSYLEIATQMFTLTLYEPSGSYFFALAHDFMSIFVITAAQCYFSSMITIALDSVSEAVYETEWYRREKSDSLDVMIMLQMAQQESSHRIWFNSFKVDRSAALNLVRSSYAVYTFLMIYQSDD